MERTVLAFIQSHNMLQNGDSVVAGVSGGADSMCLLRLLISLRLELGLGNIVAVHVNHGIRGLAADADELFVEQYCRVNGIPFEAVHANIPEIAHTEGLTEEEAGRNVRYEAFTKVCRQYGCNKIAVAHNGDDNAETVLFNIARGSGISGLRGISPTRDMGDGIELVRPLLGCTRAQIENYLAEQGMTYRIDETNLQDEYSRNKIRHTVIPALCDAVNPAAAANIRDMAERAAELEDFVKEMTEREIKLMKMDGQLKVSPDSIRIAIEPLMVMHPTLRKTFIRTQLGVLAGKLKDIEAVHVEAVCGLISKQVGRSLNLPYDMIARKDYGELIICRKSQDGENAGPDGEEMFEEVSVPGEYKLSDGKILTFELIRNEKTLNIPQNDYTKYFDYDKIMETLVLRTRRQGDYLLIKGSKGDDSELIVKSLKTWFIDKHIPSNKRTDWPLIAEGPHILWVVGERADDSCLVTSATRTILKIELKSKGLIYDNF